MVVDPYIWIAISIGIMMFLWIFAVITWTAYRVFDVDASIETIETNFETRFEKFEAQVSHAFELLSQSQTSLAGRLQTAPASIAKQRKLFAEQVAPFTSGISKTLGVDKFLQGNPELMSKIEEWINIKVESVLAGLTGQKEASDVPETPS